MKSFFSLIVLLFICAQLNAQPSQSRVQQLIAMNLGELLKVDIATGSPVEIGKAPAVATVVTAYDIQAMGARNLVDVLDAVPGLHVARNGQNMAPRFAFRGITSTYAPQALLLINGVSLKSVVRGDSHTVWGEFPVHAISRIEILRGPGSALYGADAFSGVINIITKTADELEFSEVGATIGSFDTKNVWANHGMKFGHWSMALNLEYTESDGYEGSVTSDAQTIIDATGDSLFQAGLLPFDPPDISAAPANLDMNFRALDIWSTIANQQLAFTYGLQLRREIGKGQGATEVLDSGNSNSSYKHILKGLLKPISLSDSLSWGAEIHYYLSSQDVDGNNLLFPPGAFFGAFPDGFIGNPEWREDSLKIENKFVYTGWQGHDVTLGAGYGYQYLFRVMEQKNFTAQLTPRPGGLEDVTDTDEIFMPEEKRELAYLFLQDIWEISHDWTLTAGVRYDRYSDFGSTTNPRLALVWSASDQLTWKMLYGRAFRAPSFAETIVVNNPVSLGNPNAKPENIESFEVAANYRVSDKLTVDGAVFRYDISDFISFVPSPDGPFSIAQNVGERSGYGVEMELRYVPNKAVSLLANYSYVKAEDEITDVDVGEYPEHQGFLRVNWQISEQWRAHTTASLVGERKRIQGDIRAPLDGYTSFNLGFTYWIPEMGVKLELLGRNVFDEDVREPSTGTNDFGVTPVNIPDDLPQMGRSIYFSVSKEFN